MESRAPEALEVVLTGVPEKLDYVPAVRFSKPLDPRTLTGSTVTLMAGTRAGAVPVRPVSAEHAMLLFLHPETKLLPGSDYDVFIKGAADENETPLAFIALHFRTPDVTTQDRVVARSDLPRPSSLYPAATGGPVSGEEASTVVSSVRELAWKPDPRDPRQDDELWIPQAEHFRGRWLTKLPPVTEATGPQAPSGVTALAGRVLKMNGQPLANVTLRIGAREAETDENGFFLLSGLTAGSAPLDIDGSTANREDASYGSYTAKVEVKTGVTTRLPYIIWMPKLDPQGTVRIPSPTTEETVVSSPAIPGLELRIPAGTVIRDRRGNVVTEVNVTAIPANQAPFPVPTLDVPINFTLQPGGAVLQGLTPEAKKARLYYPNYQRQLPGAKGVVWNYDARLGWFVYGLGTVSADGRHLVPDPGVVLQEFTGAMFNGSAPPSPDGGPGGDDEDDCSSNPDDGCPDSDEGGEPVSLITGQFTYKEADLLLPGVLPVSVGRTYRSLDLNRRMFGVGMTLDYDMFFWSANQYQDVDLTLPSGKRIHYTRFSPGVGYYDAKFVTYTRGIWYGSRVEWNTALAGWDVFFKDGSRWFFGDEAPIQEMTDRHGNKITFTRRDDILGPITRIDGPNGRWAEFTVNDDDVVTSARDNGGRTVSYEYDASYQLVKVTNSNGEAHRFEYNADHRLTRVRSAKGDVVLENAYSPDTGVVTGQTLGDGTTFSYSYDSTNRTTTITGRSGKIRRVVYNANRRLTSSAYLPGTPSEQATSFEYDAGGDTPAAVTEALGHRTFTYDGQGNVTSVTRLAGTAEAATTRYTYSSDFNQVTSVTDPLGHTTTLTHDARGNITTAKDALGHTTALEHDGQGRLTKVTNGLGQSVIYVYQGADLAAVTDPLGRTTRLGYDAVGRLVAVEDPMGNRTRYEYDAVGRRTAIVDPAGNRVQLGYDPNGNLTSVTDQRGNTRSYEYDALNRLSARTDPLGHRETFSYAQNGKLAQRVDRKGQISQLQYDALDRLASVTFGEESSLAYTYDAGNRRTKVVDGASGTIDYEYDGLGRLTKETSPLGSVTFSYDKAGRRLAATATQQSPIGYAYDDANRLQEIQYGGEAVGFTYDDANRRTRVALRNGVTMEYAYDAAGQLTGITYRNSAGLLGDLTYSYDGAGRVIHVGGSLAKVNLPSAVSGAVYDANNQLTTWDGATRSYDLNGNLVSDGARTFTWNARGKLTAIASGDTPLAQFSYDAQGRRIRKAVNGAATQFTYDGANALQELSDGASPSLQVSTLSGFGLDETYGRTNANGTKTEYLTDRLGSTLALSDASGALATTYAYEPYGGMSQSGAATSNARTFTGREDDGTGLLYYRARYYEPGSGRFISEDPIGIAGGVNLYGYVLADPVNLADPTGLSTVCNRCSSNHLAIKDENTSTIVLLGPGECRKADAVYSDSSWGTRPPPGKCVYKTSDPGEVEVDCNGNITRSALNAAGDALNNILHNAGSGEWHESGFGGFPSCPCKG